MKNIPTTLFSILVILLLSTSALAQINWIKESDGENYLAWSNGQKSITINNGGSATFTTGYFFTSNRNNQFNVHLKALLYHTSANGQATGNAIATLIDRDIPTNLQQGYEEINVSPNQYSTYGKYVVSIILNDGQQQVVDTSLVLNVLNNKPTLTYTPAADRTIRTFVAVPPFIVFTHQWDLVEEQYKLITFTGSDLDGDALTFSHTGILPAGIRFNTSGNSATISENPTTPGVYNFVVSVNDGQSTSSTRVSLNVLTDSDQDGIPDIREDYDGDGVIDINDNCPTTPNPDQADSNHNHIGNACEPVTFSAPIVDRTIDENTAVTLRFNVNNPSGQALSTSYSVSPSTTLQDLGPVVVNVNPQTGVSTIRLSSHYDFVQHPLTKREFDFTVTIQGNTNTATDTFHVTVNDKNRAPLTYDSTFSTIEDREININLGGHDADTEDVSSLSYHFASRPAHGTLIETASHFTYTPIPNFNGIDSFSYYVVDQMSSISNTATVTINVAGVNDVPVANAQSITVTEDSTNNGITLTGSDIDTADILTYTVTSSPTNPAHGTLSGTAPNLTYTPDDDYNGTDRFTFTVSDGALTSTANVSITVTPVNDAPVFTSNPRITSNEDTAYTYTATATDVENDVLTFAAAPVLPSWLNFDAATQVLSGTPTNDNVGTHPVTLTVTDGQSAPVEQNFIITVSNTNDAPVANPQTVATNEDVVKLITLTASDVDAADILTYTITSNPTNPAHGTLSGTAPNLTYTPAANYVGPDSFTFTVNDGTVDSAPATVSITVTAVNDAPVANDQPITVTEDSIDNIITLTASDVDTTDILTYPVTSSPTNPAHGTLTGTAPNLTYTPAANYVGADSFTFTVNDGTVDSAPATVSITITAVNDAPVANNQPITVAEDSVDNVITLTASDVDTADILTYTVTSSPTNPAHGTLTGTAPNLTYTPTAHYFGLDSFTFTVSDGALTSTATVSITITAVNDAPIFTSNPVITATEEVAYTYTATASDVEADTLTFAAPVLPTWLTFDATTQVLSGIPTNDNVGTHNVTLTVTDGNTTTPQNFIITVTNTNDAPVANDLPITVVEDSTNNVITLTASDVDAADILTYTAVDPAHGTLSGIAPNLTYTPAANYNGPDSFTFIVNDGTVNSAPATVSIIVTAVNDAPIANPQSIVTNEEVAVGVALTASDVEGDALTYTAADPAHGTLSGTAPNLTYTPSVDYVGTDSFTFTANDGTVDSAPATVSITVNSLNDAPIANPQNVITNEDTAVGITLTASDVDAADILTYAFTIPAHGTLGGTAPNLTYTPSVDYVGTDSFTFIVNDGIVDSAPAIVSITITAVNDAPIFTSTPVITATEDVAYTYTAVATDVEADTLTFAATLLPSWLNFDVATQILSGIPTNDNVGTHNVTLTVTDGALTAEQSFIITVSNTNDAPVADPQNIVTNEDTTVVIVLTASDVDAADTLTYIVVDPAYGDLNGTAPNLTYTPDADYVGTDSFTFIVNDGTVNSAAATVSITVNSINDAPVFTSNPVITATEDLAYTYTATASDVENDSLTFATPVLPSWLTFDITTQILSGTPTNDNVGTHNVTLTVTDGISPAVEQSFIITVANVNDAPVANPQTVTTDEEVAVGIILTASDADGDVLTYTLATGSTPGNATIAGNIVTYTPSADYVGTDSFTFIVNDGTVDSAAATVSIIVNSLNDAPVANPQDVTTNEDTAVGITLTGSDVDGDALTYTRTDPTHGTITGTAPNLTYTPAADYNGADSFTFIVNDGTLTSTATISITVGDVNDAPVANPQTISTRGVAVNIVLTGTDSDGTIAAYTTLNPDTEPTPGTLTGTAPNLVYTPATNYVGPDSFTFVVVDDDGLTSTPATISITVLLPPQAPVAVSQTVRMPVNTPAAVVLQARDADGTIVSYNRLSNPASGTLSGTAPNLAYTPNRNYVGSDSFTFTVVDNEGMTSDVATISLFVGLTNHAPTAMDQYISTSINTPVPVVLQGTDVDGTIASYNRIYGPIYGTLSGTAPNLIYTPNVDYRGRDTINFTVTDNEGATSTIAAIHLFVGVTNQVPVISSEPETTAYVKVPYQYQINVTSDDRITYNFTEGPAGMSIDSNGLLTWTPKEKGQYPVTITISDGQYTVSQHYVLDVVDVIEDADIMSVHLSSEVVAPGERVTFSVNVRNNGITPLGKSRINVIIPELGLKTSDSMSNIRTGNQKSSRLSLVIPYGTQPGDYTIMVSMTSGGLHETAYREITVR